MTSRNRLLPAAAITIGGVLVAGAATTFVGTLAAFRASPQERRRAMPGDAIVPEPMYVTTQAVTIAALPERVWPWLAQMGAGRGGWYSYDRVDNDGHPSARAILPEYQHVAPGDVFPALPGATDAFVVAAAQPPHELVLTGPAGGTPRVSWAFLLEPRPDGRTRLLVRSRVSPRWLDGTGNQTAVPERRRLIEHIYEVLPHLPSPLLRTAAGFGHRVMQNQQLRGIKCRAEAEAG